MNVSTVSSNDYKKNLVSTQNIGESNAVVIQIRKFNSNRCWWRKNIFVEKVKFLKNIGKNLLNILQSF